MVFRDWGQCNVCILKIITILPPEISRVLGINQIKMLTEMKNSPFIEMKYKKIEIFVFRKGNTAFDHSKPQLFDQNWSIKNPQYF